MRHRVVQRLAPSEVRVFRHLPKTNAHEARWTPHEARDDPLSLVEYPRQAALDARSFFDIVLHPEPPLGSNDPKHPNARVRMIRSVAGKQQFGSPAKYQPASPLIRQLTPEQVFCVRDR